MGRYSLPTLGDAESREQRRKRLAPQPEIPDEAKRDPDEVARLARLQREAKRQEQDRVDEASLGADGVPKWRLERGSARRDDDDTTGFLSPSPYLRSLLAKSEVLPAVSGDGETSVAPDADAMLPPLPPIDAAGPGGVQEAADTMMTVVPAAAEPAAAGGATGITQLNDGSATGVTGMVPTDAWLNDEQTLIGGTPPPTAAVGGGEADALSWLGSERTLLDTPAPVPNDDSGDWLGDEVTMLGAGRAPAAAPSWLGDDQTLQAMPSGQEPTGETEMTAVGWAPGVDDPPTSRTRLGESREPPTGRTVIGRSGDPKEETRGTTGTAREGRSGSTSIVDPEWHLGGRKGPATGEQWGDYEIGGVLGEGGMGLVYRARQISLGRRCAVKVLAPHLAADPGVRNRFNLEALSTSQLNSPHVVAVYAAGEIHDTSYFVMEFVDGMDLSDHIKERRDKQDWFKPHEAADLVVQAARGLAEAARAGLVHRDVKPGNMLLDRNKLLKITDFGIVKVMGESQLTMTGQAVGTPSYISPEQGRGDEVDERSDLYSLGVVYYLLLTGQRPFDGATPNALIYQHNYEEPKLPSELMPGVPREHDAICVKLLAKKPENRYQTARELIRDLEDMLEGRKLELAMAAKLSTGADEARKEHLTWLQRHFLPIVIGFTIVLFTGSVLGYSWFSTQQQRRDRLNDLRNGLVALDNPIAIPTGAQAQLREYDRLIEEYGGVNLETERETTRRWQQKLNDVERLRGELSALDDLELVPYAVAATAVNSLDDLRYLIGPDDADVLRWGGILNRTRQQVSALRRRLRTIDDVALFSSAQRQSFQQALDRFMPLVPEGDSDVRRWRARLEDWDRDLDSWRTALAQLDTADTVVLVRERRRLSGGLKLLTQMLGDEDPDVQRWRLELANRQARLDARLAAVGRLADRQLTTVTEAEDLAAAIAGLAAVQALDPAVLDDYRARLEEDALRRQRLRSDLTVLDQDRPLSPVLRNRLDELERVFGSQDEDVARWRAKVDRHDALVAGLAPLDDAVAIPADAAERVAALRSLVGANDVAVARWVRKLERVEKFKASLAVLDERVSHPPATAEWLRQLTELVGGDEPDVLRWQAEFEKVGQLNTRLTALAAAVVLPLDAPPALRELAALVGLDDTVVVDAARRCEELAGPARPAWATAGGFDRFGPWFTWSLGEDLAIRWRWVPAGSTVIGSLDSEAGHDPDEPRWTATISDGLWLAETELTQAQLAALAGQLGLSMGRSRYRGGELPAERISYDDISRLLTAAETTWPDRVLRLPTEVEWERACRAGLSSAFGDFAGAVAAGRLHEVAWYAVNAEGRTQVVGARRPNALGLFDMHGNVWEWCQDRYGSYPGEDAVDHVGRAGDLRVVRGGSWGDDPAALRAANRLGVADDLRTPYLGLRLALSPNWDHLPDGDRARDRLAAGELPVNVRLDARAALRAHEVEQTEAIIEAEAAVPAAAPETDPEDAPAPAPEAATDPMPADAEPIDDEEPME